jgi:hypothetical protein
MDFVLQATLGIFLGILIFFFAKREGRVERVWTFQLDKKSLIEQDPTLDPKTVDTVYKHIFGD